MKLYVSVRVTTREIVFIFLIICFIGKVPERFNGTGGFKSLPFRILYSRINMDIKKYITIYKHYYGVIYYGFVIHHLDCNRRNNHLDNLVQIPIELHTAYHRYRTEIAKCKNIDEIAYYNLYNSQGFIKCGSKINMYIVEHRMYRQRKEEWLKDNCGKQYPNYLHLENNMVGRIEE